MKQNKSHNLLHQWLEISKLEDSVTLLWSAGYKDLLGSFEGLLALGVETMDNGLESLNELDDRLRILSVSYDAKNDIESTLKSSKSDFFHRPNIELVTPKRWEVLLRDGNVLTSDHHSFGLDVIKELEGNEFLEQTELVKHWDGRFVPNAARKWRLQNPQ